MAQQDMTREGFRINGLMGLGVAVDLVAVLMLIIGFAAGREVLQVIGFVLFGIGAVLLLIGIGKAVASMNRPVVAGSRVIRAPAGRYLGATGFGLAGDSGGGFGGDGGGGGDGGCSSGGDGGGGGGC